MEPTVGGINLEDIKAPECFRIEQELIKICNIPIFHNDQHGTAIIAGAGLINATELTGRKLDELKIVFNGAGAAGISCARLFIALGANKRNMILCDSKGVVYKRRTEGMSEQKHELAAVTDKRTLAEAMECSDVFVGVSVKDCVTSEMLISMNKNPIVFAMANPDPEIAYELAIKTRGDLIMATGRSDHPNQVNNVLGFPFIFRGALDVKAAIITEGMKIAAAKSLAKLAREPVPDIVSSAYNGKKFSFGPEYIVPKPFDPRVIEWEAVAVAKAACDEGVALSPISDWDTYRETLKTRIKDYWE